MTATFTDAELTRLNAIALAAAALSDEFGDDITERDAPLAHAVLKALRAALDVAPGLAVVDVVVKSAPSRNCDRCHAVEGHTRTCLSLAEDHDARPVTAREYRWLHREVLALADRVGALEGSR